MANSIMKTGRFRNIALIGVAGCFFVVRGILYILATNVMCIYLAQLLQSVSFGLILAAKANYANETMNPEDQNFGQSSMAMTESLGLVGGSLLGGFLADRAGVNMMLTVFMASAAVGTMIVFAAGRDTKHGGR